jgi:hypothetical protein
MEQRNTAHNLLYPAGKKFFSSQAFLSLYLFLLVTRTPGPAKLVFSLRAGMFFLFFVSQKRNPGGGVGPENCCHRRGAIKRD